jgi:hypothetical protein
MMRLAYEVSGIIPSAPPRLANLNVAVINPGLKGFLRIQYERSAKRR